MVNAIDRIRIAAQIIADPRTVLRVYQGRGSEQSRLRVMEAAKALGLPPPPDRSSSSSPNSPSGSPKRSKAA
ncbi:MAG TPA: hypothetical protein VH062_10285 [Polyangiaceae bacterium]|jgi:DNA-binding LacI/PurR family transcriptional regulator|nr:hypothetical protein [Polyangiaceae bacterium]